MFIHIENRPGIASLAMPFFFTLLYDMTILSLSFKLFFLYAFVTINFLACSDDSSSSAGDEPAVSTKTSALEVDEEHNIITWTTENSKDMCLLENGSFTWKTVNLETSKESARYEFRGDTLVLYPLVYNNGKQERFGRMYLGGTAGKIYGTWRALFCDFDPVEKNTFCATGDVFTTKTITLSKGKMITETLYDFERYSAQKSGNLVLSELTADILRALKGTFELYIPGAFVDDSARVQSLIQEYKITTVSQTKKSINFMMDDKEYALKYNEAEETLAKDGSEKVNRIVKLELASEKTTCNLDFERTFVEKPLCKSENKDYLDINKVIIDGQGNTLEYAVAYLANNQEEFEKCVKSVSPASSSNGQGYDGELN